MRRLKQRLYGKLKGTRSANLVKLANATELTVQHIRRLPEVRRRKTRLDSPKVGMIEEIERLASELQLELLGKIELASNS